MGFRITVIGSDWMVGSDGVTWSYWSHGVIWLGEVGAGIPELWGQMALGRSVMGAGRVRESQDHVGIWFPQGSGSRAAMGSRTYRVMRSSWVMAHVGLRLRAPPLGHRDAQSPLKMK